jgi:hypothetical protein
VGAEEPLEVRAAAGPAADLVVLRDDQQLGGLPAVQAEMVEQGHGGFLRGSS